MRTGSRSFALACSLFALLGGIAACSPPATPVDPPPSLFQVPDFELTNRDGATIDLTTLRGAPWIADFIFTSCPGPCPLMTQRMKELGPRLPTGVRRVSFSVDPETDTPDKLDAYATSFGAPPSWLFLTGTRDELWSLSKDGFKLGIQEADAEDAEAHGADSPPETNQGPIIHSTRFVLVDDQGWVRGYYDSLRTEELDRLIAELEALIPRPE